MQPRQAVYAGSFDPLTNGHLWMIRESKVLFDRLTVAVGINPAKKGVFGVDERLTMIRESIDDDIVVDSFTDQYLVQYAQNVGAQFIVRGLRSEQDFQYEYQMRVMNEAIERDVRTVFLMPPPRLAHLSSSLVRSLIGPAGWRKVVLELVPAPVFGMLEGKYAP